MHPEIKAYNAALEPADRKTATLLAKEILFWSGQSFDEPGLADRAGTCVALECFGNGAACEDVLLWGHVADRLSRGPLSHILLLEGRGTTARSCLSSGRRSQVLDHT